MLREEPMIQPVAPPLGLVKTLETTVDIMHSSTKKTYHYSLDNKY